MNNNTFVYLTDKQIDSILNKLVPLIADPEDVGFFRFALSEHLQTLTSVDAALFIQKLCTETGLTP